MKSDEGRVMLLDKLENILLFPSLIWLSLCRPGWQRVVTLPLVLILTAPLALILFIPIVCAFIWQACSDIDL